MIEQDYYHKITDSAFITITGKDKFKFLQGLISNDLRKLDKIKCLYASMLSPHGRFLFDFFVSIFKEGYLIECKKCFIEGLLAKLKVYKLRSEVEVNILNNMNSYVINPSNKEVIKLYKSESLISFSDPRFKSYFLKIYSLSNCFEKFLKNYNLSEYKSSEFDDMRIKFTIPDFSTEADVEKSLLLELRFDELNGIDWKKGCYMGQELTARTKYRANIKKKIFGIKFDGKITTSEITANEKTVGVLKSHTKNFGIAIINIKTVEDFFNEQNFLIKVGHIVIEPFLPQWSNSKNSL